MKHMFLLAIWLLCLQLNQVLSYSSGAPSSACEDLTPQHTDHGTGQTVVPQTSPSPYSITTNSKSVNGTQPLNIVLKAEQGKSFFGFILQARKSGSQDLLGELTFTERAGGLPADIKYMSCPNGPTAAVTHTNKKPKTELHLQWESSGFYEGDVEFVGTFVQNYNTIWVAVKSEEVHVSKSADTAETTTMTHITTPEGADTTTMAPITTTDSGTTTITPIITLMSAMTTLLFGYKINLHFN